MSLSSGVQPIETSFWGRPLTMVLFRGDRVALVDTGLVGTPADAVLPHLRASGLTPNDLSLIIITHAHADHFGGNEELWLASGKKARFAAHRLDRPWIEDPPAQTRQAYGHYMDLGLMSAGDMANNIQFSGNGVVVDEVLAGGEVFDLGVGLELEIVFAPGHSAGNICVLDRKSKVLAQGETVAGVGQFDAAGKLLTVPYYEDVAVYLHSLATVARLDFETMVPSHLPVMDRRQAARFLEDSLDFALQFEQEVQQRVQAGGEGVTSLDLLRSMDGLWGRYPADLGMYMLLESHLLGLLRRGLAGGSLSTGLVWAGSTQNDLAPLEQEARTAIGDML